MSEILEFQTFSKFQTFIWNSAEVWNSAEFLNIVHKVTCLSSSPRMGCHILKLPNAVGILFTWFQYGGPLLTPVLLFFIIFYHHSIHFCLWSHKLQLPMGSLCLPWNIMTYVGLLNGRYFNCSNLVYYQCFVLN